MPPLYTFYGDDFTGSTDVLEQLAAAGIPAVLFLAPPTPADLAAFPHVHAIGLAGDSRSRTPAWMDRHLPGLFQALARLGAPIVHYKVCSTFDSSPHTGSIGRALELGIATLHPRFVPILAGAPHLRRYVAGGQLFAAAPSGQIERIDRHPMARHPVTPMREPDLRLHLARQTSARIALLDHARLTPQALESELAQTPAAVLFDTLDATTLAAAGELLWQQATRAPLFAIGSSGLTSALISAWRTRDLLSAPAPSHAEPCEGPLLVVSGSCSPVTEQQIRWALAHGFQGFRAVPGRVREIAAATARSLAQGRNTVLYTALGDSTGVTGGRELGTELGRTLAELRLRTPLRRVLLCGGDTSSHAVQQLGLTALTWKASLQPGAPLCTAHGTAQPLQLVLKGGQVGTENFFQVVHQGT